MTIAQLDAPKRGFDTSEFERRTALAQREMKALGLAGLLLTTEPEVRYFTGFYSLFWQSPTRPWFVFVPETGKPSAVIPEIGADLMRRTWIDDIRTWSAPCPTDDGLSLLVDLLKPFADQKAKIGVMKGHESLLRMPLGDWERLCAQLEDLHFQDVTKLVQSLRMVKSEAEIENLPIFARLGQTLLRVFPSLLGVISR